MLLFFSHILYIKEGIRIAPKDLRSTNKEKVLDEKVLTILKNYEDYFQRMLEIIEFIDSIRNPTGIYNTLRDYADNHGKKHYRNIITDKGENITVFDYYEPDEPDEYVMCIVDHVGLIDTERSNGIQMDLKQSIMKLSSDYFVKLRNMYNYIPIGVQQQMAGQESVENLKYNRLKPSLDGLAINKNTQQDANVILGLFSPFRHEIPNYLGYDVTYFKDNIRFMEILGGREGGAGTICPLYFDGAVNYFKELPLPENENNLKMVYRKIERIRNG